MQPLRRSTTSSIKQIVESMDNFFPQGIKKDLFLCEALKNEINPNCIKKILIFGDENFCTSNKIFPPCISNAISNNDSILNPLSCFFSCIFKKQQRGFLYISPHRAQASHCPVAIAQLPHERRWFIFPFNLSESNSSSDINLKLQLLSLSYFFF